jgi:two-component system, sensor histidine kinase YesM
MKKIKLNSILSRLFISFILVMSPILIAGVIMFSWEKQAIKTQIENSSLDNVSFLQNNLENEIQNIELLQFNLERDVYLQKLIVQYNDAPKYEYYTLIADVQQRLQVMKNSNNYIQDVVVYIPSMRHTISVTNGYIDFDEIEYNRLLQIGSKVKYPLIINNSEMFTMTLFPFSSENNKTPTYLIEVVLAQDKIKSFLGKFSKYNGSDTALYDNTSENWIFSAQSNQNNQNDAKLNLITGAVRKNTETSAKINGKDCYVISIYSSYLNASFVQYVPMEDIFKIPDRYSNYLWFYIMLSFLIMLIYSYSTYKFVKYPINTLLKSFRQLEEGDLNSHVQLKAANEFNDLFEGFNKMVYRLNDLIDRVYRQELYAKKAELKQLQSQINPHFLYNSYFMLHRMIKDHDMENAESLSSYIGNYFKYITRNSSEEIELYKEVDHAYSYAQIQKMRFPERLSVEFSKVPEKYREYMVLRMILQPILENSFEHGLKTTVKNGLVRVNFEETGTGLLVVIEDNGNSLQDEDITALQSKLTSTDNGAETTGIINVHRRTILKYGVKSGIAVSRSSLGGLRAQMLIFPESNIKKV